MIQQINLNTLLAVVALVLTIVSILAGVIIWFIRLEAKVAAGDQKHNAYVELAEEKFQNLLGQLAQAVSALSKFDESTQKQVEDYRFHTDTKIEQLGRDIKKDLENIFNKLDTKADKPKV